MKLTLTEKIDDSPNIISFIFKPDQALNFKPGQFLRYHIPNPSPDQRGENRFFSISAAPFEKVVKLTTKFVPINGSSFKKDLHNLKVGNTIEAFGPSGSFTVEDAGKQYVFIAGGIGITPFRSILLDLDHQNKPLNIALIYANRTENILFKEELEALVKKHTEYKIYYVPTIDENIINNFLSPLSSSLFYISGSEQMVIDVSDMLMKLRIPKENIKRDEFPGYKNY